MGNDPDADIIVVGAGHNSLTAAAYLATAGKRVLVLERNSYAGGGVATAELTEPGFHSERHALIHALILPNPLIANDELALQERYGLKYIYPDVPHSTVFDDGHFLPFHRDRATTADRIGQISRHDADVYGKFMDRALPIADALTASFFVPPRSAADQGGASTTPEVMREIRRTTSMSAADVIAEWFTDDHVRIALLRMITEVTVTHPDDLCTGLFAYAVPAFLERYGVALPQGGGSSFTKACIRCIEDHGGIVRTSTEVTRILSESGRTLGVRTAGGQEFRAADAVLASVHPHRLADVVEGLDPAIARTAALTKSSPYSAFVVHASLDEPLRFKAGNEVDGCAWNTLANPSLDELNRSFDDLRRGRLPAVPVLEASCPSRVDGTRAPAGKAVLHMLSITTKNLAAGGAEQWSFVKEKVADQLMARLAEFVVDFKPETVRGRAIVTPLDHEIDSPSFANGDYNGLAMYAHQLGASRPTPELSQYTVPGLKGLYLTGPFMHPGGGVVGGGRPTAIKMFDDLGLDFAKFNPRNFTP